MLNAANALTVLRLFMVPVFVLLLLAGGTGARIAALVVFLAASATDILDGRIARLARADHRLRENRGPDRGQGADRVRAGHPVRPGELGWWVTAVILARELAVTGLRFWVLRHGVIAASRGGKVKTMLQVLAIALYVVPGPPACSATW